MIRDYLHKDMLVCYYRKFSMSKKSAMSKVVSKVSSKKEEDLSIEESEEIVSTIKGKAPVKAPAAKGKKAQPTKGKKVPPKEDDEDEVSDEDVEEEVPLVKGKKAPAKGKAVPQEEEDGSEVEEEEEAPVAKGKGPAKKAAPKKAPAKGKASPKEDSEAEEEEDEAEEEAPVAKGKGKKAPVAKGKGKKAAKDDDEEVEDKKVRHFRIVLESLDSDVVPIDHISKKGGRIAGKLPGQAAKKAFTSICKAVDNGKSVGDKTEFDTEFQIEEITAGSNRKISTYTGTQKLLDEPTIVHRDGKEIKIYTEKIVKAVKAPPATKAPAKKAPAKGKAPVKKAPAKGKAPAKEEEEEVSEVEEEEEAPVKGKGKAPVKKPPVKGKAPAKKPPVKGRAAAARAQQADEDDEDDE